MDPKPLRENSLRRGTGNISAWANSRGLFFFRAAKSPPSRRSEAAHLVAAPEKKEAAMTTAPKSREETPKEGICGHTAPHQYNCALQKIKGLVFAATRTNWPDYFGSTPSELKATPAPGRTTRRQWEPA